MSQRVSLSVCAPVISLALLLGGSPARADDLSLGSKYNSSIEFYENGSLMSLGGGSIVVSSLNSETLAFVYCVDLNNHISVPGSYNATTTTTDGVVHGGSVTNAGEVAWLLDEYAAGAETNTNAQIGLQAAIWHVIYGSTYHLDTVLGSNPSAAIADYTNDLNALSLAKNPSATSLSNFDWFSPAVASSKTIYQGLIGGNNGTVPEPMSIVLLGTALLCLPKLRHAFSARRQR